MALLFASIRLAAASMLVAVAGYAALIWAIGQAAAPEQAAGSLLRDAGGAVIGARNVAQGFSRPDYFWPRPSAVGYNAAGAGGSNKASTSPDLTARAAQTVAAYGATPSNPLPAELAAASGAGLDPHISEHAALYQAPRVAAARGLSLDQVQTMIAEAAFSPGGRLSGDRLVNVLELNLALDALGA